jgi:crotonobetainyl-CoA:carnitine CoA-transferase CaiB-like acyl-CoA transferase
MGGALEGILVADFSRVLAGPFATMLLGDLGAEVVKVERRGAGDETRRWGPPFSGDVATYFLAVNRNKRSIALDLSEPADQEVARRLATRADVLVENFRPGAMERFGLGYESLREANPGLVYCSVTGFGSDGAAAALPGYDFVVQALGGLMSITGPGPDQPTKVGVAVVDVVTGLFAAVGILAALAARGSTGRGQRVGVDLFGSLLAALVNQASGYLVAGVVPRAMGNRHPSVAPYETLAAADRPLVVAAGTDAQFRSLVRVLGDEALADDPRFASNGDRVRNRELLAGELEERLRERPAADWVAALGAAGVPCGLVQDVAEAFALAERLGRRVVVEIPRGAGPPLCQVANPVALSETPPTYRLPPPGLGEHDEAVRSELGLGRDARQRPPEAGAAGG